MGSPARLAALALLALGASAAPARGDGEKAAGPPRVAVMGSPGPALFTPGSPIPVAVEVRDPPAGARVVLAVPRGMTGRRTRAILEAPLPDAAAGGPGSVSRVDAVVAIPEGTREIEARVEAPGRPAVSVRVSLAPLDPRQRLVLVTPAGGGAAAALRSVRVPGHGEGSTIPALEVAEFEPRWLPRCAAGFASASAVVFAGDPGPLPAETVAALRDYVTAGGTLVAAAGADSPALWKCGLGPLLPADAAGVGPLAAAALARRFGGDPTDARDLLAARFVPGAGARVEASAGGLPIVVVRRLGRGSVVACAVRPGEAGIPPGILDHLGLLGTGTLLGARPVLEPWRAALPLDAAAYEAEPPPQEASWTELANAEYLTRVGTIPESPGLPRPRRDEPSERDDLEDSFLEGVLSGIAAPSPPVASVAIGSGVYVTLLAVLLVWTRRAGRTGAGYALVGVPSLLGVGAVAALAGSLHSPASACAVAGVIEAGAGSAVGEATLVVGFYSPVAAEIEFALPPGTQWLGDRGAPAVGLPGADGAVRRATTRAEARSAAALLARGFVSLGDGISCEWRDDSVLVRNGTPWRLRDAVVVRGPDVAELGEIPPGRGARALTAPGRPASFRFPADPPPVFVRAWPGTSAGRDVWHSRLAAAALGGPPLLLARADAPDLVPAVSGAAFPGRARVVLAAWLSPRPRAGWTAAPFPAAAGTVGPPSAAEAVPVGLSGLVALQAPEDAPEAGDSGLRLVTISPGVVLNVPRAGASLWDAWERRWRDLPEPTEVWRGEATIGARDAAGDLPGPAARYALPGGVFLLATPWRGKAVPAMPPLPPVGFRVLEAALVTNGPEPRRR